MLRKRAPIFGGGGGGGLPTTAGKDSYPDGSGKSIKMEAPLAKAIRSADGFVKGTYIWFFVSIFFIWGGASWIRRNSSSMVLDCNSGGCTLTIQAPYSFLPRNSSTGVPVKTRSKSKRRTTIKLERDQIVRADNIKWDPTAQVIVKNYGMSSPTYASQQQNEEDGEMDEDERKPRKPKAKSRKKNYSSSSNRNGGPDRDGNYDSYILVFRDPLPPSFENGEEDDKSDPNESPSIKMQRKMAAQHRSMTQDPNSLASLLAPFVIGDDYSSNTSTEYFIHPRDFNVGQTRRLARTAVSKITAYTKGRRSTCILRENRPVAWQGLVLLILGIFSVVLCLLIGQFWEEHDPTKVGSYRKRMAEIRKREERQKTLRQRRSVRKPPLKRPGGRQPALRRPEGTRSMGNNSGGSALRTSASGTVRTRPNAGARRTTGGESWMRSAGGAGQALSKRGY